MRLLREYIMIKLNWPTPPIKWKAKCAFLKGGLVLVLVGEQVCEYKPIKPPLLIPSLPSSVCTSSVFPCLFCLWSLHSSKNSPWDQPQLREPQWGKMRRARTPWRSQAARSHPWFWRLWLSWMCLRSSNGLDRVPTSRPPRLPPTCPPRIQVPPLCWTGCSGF